MERKKNLILATLFSVGAMAVAIGAIAINSASFKNSITRGVKAADSWTEKAYVAPTENSVGYKHYYLGCPGNYRTSDADHLNEVSLEDITIPKLNVIDRSAVDSGDAILNVNEDKIKWLDQTTELGQEPGTAVFVNDAGHNAIFFSRSNQLGDDHYSEFRFNTNSSKLTSVTFDYRYLDYNESHVASDGQGHHYFFEFKVGTYERVNYDLINDDQWHTATIPVRDDARDNVTAFLFNIYEFQGHCFVSNFHFNGFDDLELEAATLLDTVDPVTISDIGLTSGFTIPQNHQFGTYDFDSHKAIDLWFEYNYTVNTADSYIFVYLFNQYDEAGAVIRLQTNRADDDGIVPAYICTMNDYGPSTTFVKTPGSAGTFFYFPRISGVKSTTQNVMHITAYCIDATTNTYEVAFMLGVKGGDLYYPSTNPEALDNQKVTFKIELGAGYFDAGYHQRVRFSSVNNDTCTATDYLPQATPEVVYYDHLGNIVGKKATNALQLPAYAIQSNKLVGWFDQDGNKLENGQTITKRIIARPVFINEQDHMLTLTDVGFASSLALTPDSGEANSPVSYSLESGNRIDFYFIYQFEGRTVSDNYFICGMNYDMIDAKTRIMIRIDNGANDKRVCGHIYGASLGNAGDAGTKFESSNVVRANENTPLLVHVTLIDNGSNSASVNVDFTNLADNSTYSTSRDVSFATDWNLSPTYDARNKFGYTRPIGCSATIRSVF